MAVTNVMPQPIAVYHGQWMASFKAYLMASMAAREVAMPMMMGRLLAFFNTSAKRTPPRSAPLVRPARVKAVFMTDSTSRLA